MMSERKPLEGTASSRLDRGRSARTQKELALMGDLLPLLKKRAGGREIAGLKAYEE
jgi:type I restriction enzyme R subunit